MLPCCFFNFSIRVLTIVSKDTKNDIEIFSLQFFNNPIRSNNSILEGAKTDLELFDLLGRYITGLLSYKGVEKNRIEEYINRKMNNPDPNKKEVNSPCKT